MNKYYIGFGIFYTKEIIKLRKGKKIVPVMSNESKSQKEIWFIAGRKGWIRNSKGLREGKNFICLIDINFS